LDHPVAETEPFGFAKLGSAEQISAPCIDQKSEHLVWQNETSDFF
jgi:hypothetical protein